ncbi:xanthotoxin 5-hydroxylase CYP82C4-like [Aristolochia californica]|uniref:xanthotoxin 5-hydroxylase CYP82C4-like n=1 Tax=Aristolochia californica TaxID=171875 RepID=UPI0035E38E16
MEFSFLMQIVAAVIAALLLKLWLARKQSGQGKRKTGKAAPEPPGAWPIIGHLPLLASVSHPHRAFAALADKYGPAFIIRMGLSRMLIVSTKEVAKECFTTNDRVFATRPHTIAGKLMAYDHAIMGFSPLGPVWKESRKIATMELFSARRIEMLKHVRSSEINAWVKELFVKWRENEEKPLELEMKSQLDDLTFNVLMQMVAGKRYFGDNVDKADEEMASSFSQAMKQFNHYLGTSGIYDALPFLEWFDFKGDAKAMKRAHREMDSIVQNWVDEHRERRGRRGGSSSSDQGHDFIDVLLSMEEAGQFTVTLPGKDTAIKALALTQLVAGVDSMANTLVWALSLLLTNRHVLEKVLDELDSHVGRVRFVEESDLPKLKYLQAVVKESMRLFPVGPLLVPHEAMEDCQVAGHFVPRGTGLFINAWAIQRDPRVWSDPDKFLPDRFMTIHADMELKGQHFDLLPFGSGRRSCPGAALALQVVYVTLARILQVFDIMPQSNVPLDLEEGFGLLLYKLNPLKVQIKPRLPHHFYE